MSEHILKILLEEIKTLRLTCVQCGAVAELPIDKLNTMTGSLPCPGCNSPFRDSRNNPGDAFDSLALALRQLAAKTNRVKIEFVLPAKPPTA